MARLHPIPLVALFLAGCIFVGQDDSANNSGSNNATNNATNDATNNATNNGTTVPDMGAEATYIPLIASSQDCAQPLTARFIPDMNRMDPPLNDSSHVAAAGAPNDVALLGGVGEIGDFSIAYATRTPGSVELFAAAATLADASGRIAPVISAGFRIPVDAEVLGLTLSSNTFLRNEANPVQPALTMFVATSRGVYDCVMTVDTADAAAIECSPSPLNDTLSVANVARAARVDAAPIFEINPNNNNYLYSLANTQVLALVSGPNQTGEEMAALRSRDNGYDVVNLDVSTVLDAPEVFAERTAFGVEDTSFGHPLIMMLGHREDGALEPLILKSTTPSATEYKIDDRGVWTLSERLDPKHQSFTFVDGYDVDVALNLLLFRMQITPGFLNLGYVGIASDRSGLVFSRPGGFSGGDFLEFELPNASEVRAFRNIPTSTSGSGSPAIAVIHGPNSDQLAVFNWNFSTDARWNSNLLAANFSEAQRMSPVWFFEDTGMISMLAKFDAEWALALVPIPDVTDLRRGCQ